jgi:hypothetical protein
MATTAAPNSNPPPRMRQSIGLGVTPSSRTNVAPVTEMAGTISPSRNTVS